MPEAYRDLLYEKYSLLSPQGCAFDAERALRWGRSYRYLLKKLLPADRKSAVLDLGCGNGALLFNIKTLGFDNVTGVDVSRQLVDAADAALNCVHGSALHFLEDVYNRFDVITAFDFFEHFRKDEFIRLLELTFGALKPSGRLILQTVNAHSPMGLSCRYTDFTHEIAINAGCLKNLMEMIGFVNFKPLERGPMPYNAVNAVRYLCWRCVRLGLMAYDLIEVADTRFGIYTRDFLAVAFKPLIPENVSHAPVAPA